MGIASVAALAALGSPTVAAPAAQVWLRGTDAQGRVFDLERLRGQVVVLSFASRRTAREVEKIQTRLEPLLSPGDVTLVTVVDLEDVPSIMHGYARRRIVEAAERSHQPHLVDERGRLARAFGADGADVLVIDRDGRLRARFRGEAEVEGAVRAVGEARQIPPP